MVMIQSSKQMLQLYDNSQNEINYMILFKFYSKLFFQAAYFDTFRQPEISAKPLFVAKIKFPY